MSFFSTSLDFSVYTKYYTLSIICLNVMLLISCWYLIAENQKNKSKINGLEDDLNKAIKRLSALEEEGVTQKS